MKRRLCLTLLLMLTVISASISAYAVGYDTIPMSESAWVFSPVEAFGELYFLSDGQLYMLGENKKTLVQVPEITDMAILASGGDKLYGVSYGGSVYLLEKDFNGKIIKGEPIKIKLPDDEDAYLLDGAVDQNNLYLLYGDGSAATGKEKLIKYGFESGLQAEVPAGGILQITSFKEGKLLALKEDIQERGKSKICLLGPETGGQESFTTLPIGQAGGLAYDIVTDTVYVGVGGVIYESISRKEF